MRVPAARAHKEYQEFVKNEFALRRIKVPSLFQDVFIKLFYLDLSPVSRIPKERYSHQGEGFSKRTQGIVLLLIGLLDWNKKM
ncbi:hypothetical protein IBX65_06600 [Candidatus Aerophobetes bacterium]|nr:hypothetical protein [Candidatus Aerophobetes bacterium]